ncbi:MAG: hypothetical protein B7Y83_12910 [Flavobacteriales bacterium 32-34-25]|nr:MAG: hypothetical protein B7Y83_12910 [Flavobacteriales bacterium 32-34-25]
MQIPNLSDFERLPDIEKYREDLNFIRNQDLSQMSVNEISKLISEKAIILPTITSTTEIANLGTSLFYRVRIMKHSNISNEDMTLIQSFSYPPSITCKENGRANLKKTSVFYCASTGDAAMRESDIEIGSQGFLSVWTIDPQTTLKFGILLSDKLPKENPWKPLVDYLSQEEFQKIHLEREGKYYEHMRELRNFFYDLYMHEAKPYPITSFISNSLLYSRNDLDFISYPCVKRSHRQINFAFHPNSVNLHFKIERVFRFEVTAMDVEGISFNVNGVGYLEKSRIQWRNADESDEHYLGKITSV